MSGVEKPPGCMLLGHLNTVFCDRMLFLLPDEVTVDDDDDAVVSRTCVKYLSFRVERAFLDQFALWSICSVLFLLLCTRKN